MDLPAQESRRTVGSRCQVWHSKCRQSRTKDSRSKLGGAFSGGCLPSVVSCVEPVAPVAVVDDVGAAVAVAVPVPVPVPLVVAAVAPVVEVVVVFVVVPVVPVTLAAELDRLE